MLEPGEPARIRPAVPADAAALASIYNHYVANTTVTFEEEPVGVDEMESRVRDVSATGLWLLSEHRHTLAGYAYAKPYHPRSGYRHSFESTIYLHPDATGRGLGTHLYRALLEALARRPVHRVIGVIALPNPASVALHERLGFTPAGRLSEVGRKLGRWVDVGHWVLPLAGVTGP